MLGAERPDCQRCVLRQTCGQVVWGTGPVSSELMIVGEYPDTEDDLMGEPFSGRSGVVLKRLLSAAGIDFSQTYATLAVKCMPTKKNGPTKEHLNACRNHLWAEMRAVQPKVILTLGRTPTALLLKLNPSTNLSVYAGHFHTVEYTSSLIAVWYSPNWIMQQGRAWDNKAVEFFKQVKEKCV